MMRAVCLLTIAATAAAQDVDAIENFIGENKLPDTASLETIKTYIRDRIPPLEPPADKDAWRSQAERIRENYRDNLVLRGVPDAWREHNVRVEWIDDIETNHGYRIRKLRLIRGLGECVWSDLVGAERWCEKSPANVFYFHEIRQAIGPIRFIQIVRDGRDVVTSVHPQAPERPWVPIDRWRDAVAAGLVLRERPDALTIRYRDLVLDPDVTIRRLCSFLSEPYGEEIRAWREHATVRVSGNLMGAQIESLHARSVGKFRHDDCPFPDRVEALMADGEAVALLDAYGFRETVTT